MSLISPFAQYKSREDILAHIGELEDICIMRGGPGKDIKKIGEHARLIKELKKMAEDFPV